VGLERGLLSLVKRTDELLERKNSASDLENQGIHCGDHAVPSTHRSQHIFACCGSHLLCIFHLQIKSHGVSFMNQQQLFPYVIPMFIIKVSVFQIVFRKIQASNCKVDKQILSRIDILIMIIQLSNQKLRFVLSPLLTKY
jgi:hypothetical protein